MKRSTVLVTGGAGFIGSHLVRELLARKHAVRVLDNFVTGKRANLDGVSGPLEIVEGDQRDPAVCARVMRDVQYVLAVAALPSVSRSVADPRTSHDVNVNGIFNLLMAARDAGVERFVYSSSSSVYGNTPQLPKREDMSPSPLSPYAVSKLTGEYYCNIFSTLYNLPTVSMRYFNVFGPRQDPNSQYSGVISRFCTSMLRGESPVLNGDGTQTRDFTYVANVVHANLLACTAPLSGPLIVNIGAGQRTSLLDLLHALEGLTGRIADPIFQPERPGDVRDSQADITRAQATLAYTPIVDFHTGLRETLAHFKSML